MKITKEDLRTLVKEEIDLLKEGETDFISTREASHILNNMRKWADTQEKDMWISGYKAAIKQIESGLFWPNNPPTITERKDKKGDNTISPVQRAMIEIEVIPPAKQFIEAASTLEGTLLGKEGIFIDLFQLLRDQAQDVETTLANIKSHLKVNLDSAYPKKPKDRWSK